MHLDFIIYHIELYYKQYCEQGSENTFNGFTDFFFDKLNRLPLCKQILEEIATKNNIRTEDFEIRQKQCIYEFLVDIFNKGEEYYVAYCYKYYQYLRNQKKSGYCPGEAYYDDVKWTDKGLKEEGDKVRLFKTDFVRPIVNYLIGNLNNESIILYHLQKYKERIERFKSIRYSKELNELLLQRDMALFLFDHHLDYWKEVDTSNGRIDFVIGGESKVYGTILECNDKPYVIEIKYFDNKQDLSCIEESKKQLLIYMEQVSSYGCLIIYTNDETDYDLSDWSDSKIKVMSIYIGEKTPSKRHYRLLKRKTEKSKSMSILRKTTDQFVAEAYKVHGDRYDYSKVEYVNTHVPVIIRCNQCGFVFSQEPSSHLAGRGCPKCSKKQTHKRVNQDMFIARAKEVHGDKYDYSKVDYHDMHSKVLVICPRHGEFYQRAQSHLLGSGCPKCKYEKHMARIKGMMERQNE